MGGYLPNATGPVSLVLDLRIDHDHFGSISDPNLNGNLHYPNDIDRSLNQTVTDKIRKYCTDYDDNPPNAISSMPPIASTSGTSRTKNSVCLLSDFSRGSCRCSRSETSHSQISHPHPGSSWHFSLFHPLPHSISHPSMEMKD